ncbi:retrovirus-related pol polyprotein from transposon TNT 1-94 [Tanacetum coccineum]
MCALLIQHGCDAALEVLPVDMEAQTKAELNKKAHSAMILCLGNKVLREVTGETTTAGVWSKLETLYMTQSLANKFYLKKKLYTFCMLTGRKISEHIDEFNKIVLDLANIEVKFEDEDLAFFLEDVMATLNSKEIKERSKAKGDDGEGLYVRERTDRRDSCQSRGKSRSKSRGYVKKDEQPSSRGSTYDDSEVMMVMSAQAQALLDWIVDSGCSYHMTPKLDIFFDFLECDGGSVQLGDNRYIPELKRNMISLGTLEKEGYIVKLQSSKVKVSLMLVLKKKTVLCRFGTKDWDISARKVTSSQFWCRKAHYSESNRLCSFRLMRSISGGIIGRFKHEAFGKFKEWKQLVENPTGRTVKKLRTNNGLEFYNQEFKQLCIESGIARHLTVSEMPQ